MAQRKERYFLVDAKKSGDDMYNIRVTLLGGCCTDEQACAYASRTVRRWSNSTDGIITPSQQETMLAACRLYATEPAATRTSPMSPSSKTDADTPEPENFGKRSKLYDVGNAAIPGFFAFRSSLYDPVSAYMSLHDWHAIQWRPGQDDASSRYNNHVPQWWGAECVCRIPFDQCCSTDTVNAYGSPSSLPADSPSSLPGTEKWPVCECYCTCEWRSQDTEADDVLTEASCDTNDDYQNGILEEKLADLRSAEGWVLPGDTPLTEVPFEQRNSLIAIAKRLEQIIDDEPDVRDDVINTVHIERVQWKRALRRSFESDKGQSLIAHRAHVAELLTGELLTGELQFVHFPRPLSMIVVDYALPLPAKHADLQFIRRRWWISYLTELDLQS